MRPLKKVSEFADRLDTRVDSALSSFGDASRSQVQLNVALCVGVSFAILLATVALLRARR